jgi:hypothetical protein
MVSDSCKVEQLSTKERTRVRRLIGRLRRIAGRIYESAVVRSPGRADDPYVTHTPVLAGLSVHVHVRRVLELGSGTHSTFNFLNRRVFPHLECIDSYENDPQWASRVLAAAGGDQRLKLRVTTRPMAECVRDLALSDYDLILIDDSQTSVERSATIMAIAGSRPIGPIVVIHDFEVSEYRKAASGFEHRFRLTCLNPNSGVVWNGQCLGIGDLRAMQRAIKKVRDRIPLGSIEEWYLFLETRAGGAVKGRLP